MAMGDSLESWIVMKATSKYCFGRSMMASLSELRKHISSNILGSKAIGIRLSQSPSKIELKLRPVKTKSIVKDMKLVKQSIRKTRFITSIMEKKKTTKLHLKRKNLRSISKRENNQKKQMSSAQLMRFQMLAQNKNQRSNHYILTVMHT